MTANKMPEMPDYLDTDLSHMSLVVLHSVVEDYGRACYLAGIEAAKNVVRDTYDPYQNAGVNFEELRTNLTALEQEAKK